MGAGLGGIGGEERGETGKEGGGGEKERRRGERCEEERENRGWQKSLIGGGGEIKERH